jgi:hypothetical protein
MSQTAAKVKFHFNFAEPEFSGHNRQAVDESLLLEQGIKMKSMSLALLGFALAGCATVTVVEGNKIEEAVGNLPQFGVTSSVPVGEVLFSQFRYWRKTGYVLRDAANVSMGGGQVQGFGAASDRPDNS